MNVRYEGFFLYDTELESELNKDIEFKHVTTEYKPARTHEHLYGKEVTMYITGYGNDGKNEGVSVKLGNFVADEELEKLFNQIPKPHITLSVSNEGKPVDTANLIFEHKKLDKFPKVLILKFGGFIGKPIFSVNND